MQKEETDLRDRTKAFALRIVRMFSALPKTTEAHVLGKQLLRSGTSIGANHPKASEDFVIHFLILPSSFFLSQSPR
jgi:four helix bundle protein